MSEYAKALAQMNSRESSMGDFVMKTVMSHILRDMFQGVDPAEKHLLNQTMSQTSAMTQGENLAYRKIESSVDNYQKDLLGVVNSVAGNTKDYTDTDGVVDYAKRFIDTKAATEKYVKGLEDRLGYDKNNPGSAGAYEYNDPLTGKKAQGSNKDLNNMANMALNTIRLNQTELLNGQLALSEMRTDRDILQRKLTAVGGNTGTGIVYNQGEGNQQDSLLKLIDNFDKSILRGASANTKFPAVNDDFVAGMSELKKVLNMASQFDLEEAVGIQLDATVRESPLEIPEDATGGAKELKMKFGGMNITHQDAAEQVDKWIKSGDYGKASSVLERMLPHKDAESVTRSMLLSQKREHNIKWNGILNEQGHEEAGLHTVATDLTSKITNQSMAFSPDGGFMGWGEELVQLGSKDYDFYKEVPGTIKEGFKSLSTLLTPLKDDGRTRTSNIDFNISDQIPKMAAGAKELFKIILFGDAPGAGDGTEYLNSKDGKMYGMTGFKNDKGSVININQLNDEAIMKLMASDIKVGGSNKFGLMNNVDNEEIWNSFLLGNPKSTESNKDEEGLGDKSYTSFGQTNPTYNHLHNIEGETLQAFSKLWVKKNQGLMTNKAMLKTQLDLTGTEIEIDKATEKTKIASEIDWNKPTDRGRFSEEQLMVAIELGEHYGGEMPAGGLNDSTTSVTNKGLNKGVYKGTEDLGSFGFNTAWTNKAEKGATGKDKNFAFNDEGDEDNVYNIVQKGLNKQISGFSEMSNEDRKAAFLGLDKKTQWKFANTVELNRGLGQWSSLESIQKFLGQSPPPKVASSVAPKGMMQDPVSDHPAWIPIPKDDDDPSLIVLKGLGLNTTKDEEELGFIASQGQEVQGFRDELDNLRSENPSVYALLENLDQLENNYKSIVSKGYQDTGLGKALGHNEDVGFEQIKTSINKEVEAARHIYDLAKEYGMTEWYSNVGDQADAGYSIINSINNKGGESRFDNHKLNALVAEFNVLQENTDQLTSPLVKMANEDHKEWTGGSNMGTHIDAFRPASLGGQGFNSSKVAMREQLNMGVDRDGGVASEEKQLYLTGKERLESDMAELNQIINSQDPKLNSTSIRTKFANLTSRYNKENAELVGMAGTEDAALAVLKALSGGTVLADIK